MDATMQESQLKAGEMNLGTSIMATAFDGGVVIGADSRTTMGAYIVRSATSFSRRDVLHTTRCGARCLKMRPLEHALS